MSIKIKTIIVIIVTLLSYSFMVSLVNNGYLKEGLDKEEIQNAKKDMNKLLIMLSKEKNELEAQAYDYAVWDDSYFFMDKKNDTYIKANYFDSFLNDRKYSIVALFDLKNNLYYGRYKDKEGVWNELTTFDSKKAEVIKNVKSGVFCFLDDNYLIGNHSIILSDKTGNPKGYLMFGKRLGDIITVLKERGLDVEFKLIYGNKDDKKEFEKTEEIFKNLDSKTSFFEGGGGKSALRVENEKWIETYSVMNDIKGEKLAVIKVTTPRRINNIWMNSYLYIWFIIFISAIIISLTSYLALSKIITKPLSELARFVELFRPENDFNPNENAPYRDRKDEIGSLANSFEHLKSNIIEGNHEILVLNECLAEEVEERTKELKIANSELMISERIVLQTSEGICITDLDGTIIRVNDAFCRLAGFEREELIGKNPRVLKSGQHNKEFYKEMWRSIKTKGEWSGEVWNKRKNGEIYPKWLTINTILDDIGDPKFYLAISSDISKIKQSEEKIRQLAYFDSLTGLPNRFFFKEILQKSIIRAMRVMKYCILLFLDLDRFKVINDSLGHSVGDKVLIETGKRLKRIVKNSDTVSRLGGDEFTIILEEVDYDQEIIPIVERIIKEVSKPMIIDERELSVGTTIGVAFAPIDDTTVEGLIMKADSAMYDAKENKKGLYSFYSRKIQEKNRVYVEMEARIKEALLSNSFELFLQPKVLISGSIKEICGAEALLRLKDENGNYITPDNFIKVAEETGLIILIGEWVIEEACQMMSKLNKIGIDISIAVNVSVKQFDTTEIVDILKKSIFSTGIESKRLEIEITESVFKRDIKQINEILYRIKEIGIKISIDDFGTGYSSLSTIAQLPIDCLKIDKSFTDKLGTDEIELVSTINGIANSLSLSTIVEGVETKEQIDIISQYGTIIIQGYYFSKPLDLDRFIEYYKSFGVKK